MTLERDLVELRSLLRELCKLPEETEWVEFKQNNGVPLVDTQRFIDSPARSRNEWLASFMRRIGICEERGSGIDKVITEVEIYQLPAPIFEQTEEHTRVVLFSYKSFKEMDTNETVRQQEIEAEIKGLEGEILDLLKEVTA